jgi:hypothetical protein
MIEAAEAAERFIAGRQRADLDTDQIPPWQIRLLCGSPNQARKQ